MPIWPTAIQLREHRENFPFRLLFLLAFPTAVEFEFSHCKTCEDKAASALEMRKLIV